MGEPFRKAGWEVTDVDWDGRYGAEIQTDITTWDYKSAFKPGILMQYGRVQTVLNIAVHEQQADHEIMRRPIGWSRHAAIILNISPNICFVENPDSGDLTQAMCRGFAVLSRRFLHVRMPIPQAHEVVDKLHRPHVQAM